MLLFQQCQHVPPKLGTILYKTNAAEKNNKAFMGGVGGGMEGEIAAGDEERKNSPEVQLQKHSQSLAVSLSFFNSLL